jgi:hypothetical protein
MAFILAVMFLTRKDLITEILTSWNRISTGLSSRTQRSLPTWAGLNLVWSQFTGCALSWMADSRA